MKTTLGYTSESTSLSNKETDWLTFREAISKSSDTTIQNHLRYYNNLTQSKPVLLYSLNLTGGAETLHTNKSVTTASSVEQFDFFNKFTYSIFSLLNEYITSQKDIPDLAQELGESWNASSVIMLIEQRGASRDFSSIGISADDEVNTLNKIANLRASKQSTSYNSQSWIKREVIATQRLEIINVFPEDLSE